MYIPISKLLVLNPKYRNIGASRNWNCKNLKLWNLFKKYGAITRFDIKETIPTTNTSKPRSSAEYLLSTI